MCSRTPTVPKNTAMRNGEKNIWSTNSFFAIILKAFPGNLWSSQLYQKWQITSMRKTITI
jgi:hypothetical protein